MGKITPEKKEEIKKLHEQGMNIGPISKKLDVAHATVARLVNPEVRLSNIEKARKWRYKKSQEKKALYRASLKKLYEN